MFIPYFESRKLKICLKYTVVQTFFNMYYKTGSPATGKHEKSAKKRKMLARCYEKFVEFMALLSPVTTAEGDIAYHANGCNKYRTKGFN